MLSAIHAIFNAFFDICCFRKNPQDLPKSNVLLSLSVAGYILASAMLALLSAQIVNATLAGVIEALLVMVFTYGLLQFGNKTERWSQTVTALAGTGIVISLIALPLYYLGSSLGQEGTGQSIGLLLLIVLIIWNIAIMAHIFRHALQTTIGLGIIIAISYIWVISNFIALLFPAETS
ncbi:MAG: hypothetical protein A2W28_09025 [Gammaproteobacteria bacterium RBG_16_51_14]|nr:MAG: hypothetical protein A2W28_09025 [Gammaproteobacteria bacterium RBG_16_51_14]